MERYIFEDILAQPDNFIQQALDEAVFVYPTDTIYGIGGIVTPHVVHRISTYKSRAFAIKHYSVVAPSYERIHEHCQVQDDLVQEREHRSGIAQSKGYAGITMLLPKKDPTAFGLLTSNDHLGVRILAHPFQKLVQQIGQPVITTSVNYTGQTPISHPDEIENPDKLIDIVLDAGKAPNQKSSLLVHYTTKELIER